MISSSTTLSSSLCSSFLHLSLSLSLSLHPPLFVAQLAQVSISLSIVFLVFCALSPTRTHSHTGWADGREAGVGSMLQSTALHVPPVFPSPLEIGRRCIPHHHLCCPLKETHTHTHTHTHSHTMTQMSAANPLLLLWAQGKAQAHTAHLKKRS